MNPARAAAIRYLRPRFDSFWRWDDEGTVLAWKSGTTIVFREELARILEPLACDELPPLNSVLLLLAGLRSGGELPAEWLARVRNAHQDRDGPRWLHELRRALLPLGRLNIDERNAPSVKQTLVQTVFEGIGWHDAVRVAGEAAREVIQMLHDGVGQDVCDPYAADNSTSSWVVDGGVLLVIELNALIENLRGLDEQKLELLRRTGLENVVEPAPEVDVPSVAARKLLESLRGDEELGAMARLAREVMAAVTLPRRVSEHEDLPLGGVSDLSNRGTLDRLLLSELAHDDETLSARLAAGEALYLRRESPPKSPHHQRVIVVESGIRAWGVPRVFATSVALALVAMADPRIDVQVFRAQGCDLEAVDLTRRATLIDHLEALDLALHPGPAVPELATRFAADKQDVELLLVTTEEAAGDAEFRRELLRWSWPDLVLATVDREGHFRLRRVTGAGYVPLREARLRLEDLWAGGEKPRRPVIDSRAPDDLPSILFAKPFPLLLPHPVRGDQVWSAGGCDVLSVTHDRRLTLWDGRDHGPRQLSQEMPAGKLLWCSPTRVRDRSSAILGTGGRQLSLVHVDVNRLECEQIPLHCESGVRAVTVHGDTIFEIGDQQIIFRRLEDGEAFDTWQPPRGFAWRCGRFVEGPDGVWWMLTSGVAGGMRIRRISSLQDVPKRWHNQLAAMVELPDNDGPAGITNQGDLLLFSSQRIEWLSKDHGLPPPVRLLAVARDGTRIVLGSHSSADERLVRIRLDTWQCETVRGDPAALANQHLLHHVRSLAVRHRFGAVGVSHSEIHLPGRKGARHRICLDPESRRIEMRYSVSAEAPVRFQSLHVPGVGFQVSVARWPDGSRIFLDSRGMLHLKSSSPSIPEVSIVLSDHGLAGWCSDGRFWGTGYFVGDAPRAEDADVFLSCIQPFLQRLQARCPS